MTPLMKRLPYRLLLVAVIALFAGVLIAQEISDRPTIDQIQRLVPEIINTYPHDTDAFTQGLLLYDGFLYESTGLYGESDLRRVDLVTGEALEIIPLSDEFFAEGLALIDDRFIQLTWREGTAFVYDRDTLELLGAFRYNNEGWGLCYDGDLLYHSDGSSFITVRDPETFAEVRRFEVTIDGVPVVRLNELECVGDHIYSNVWQTTRILRINKATGAVSALIDGQALEDAARAAYPDAVLGGTGNVLNGIAYNAEDDTFYVTGKKWPALFEVRFVTEEE